MVSLKGGRERKGGKDEEVASDFDIDIIIFFNEIRIFDKSIRIENLWTASATMFIERGRDRKDKKEEVEKERN